MIRCNPPWTEKILNKHWVKLEALVGPKWMPQAAAEHPGLAKQLKLVEEWRRDVPRVTPDQKERWETRLREEEAKLLKMIRKKKFGFKEYGSGHYGTVMPTSEPGVVIKVTTDPTEAAFVAAYLSMPKNQQPVGIVPYHKIVAIRGESHLKRPVFVLWRDEAQYVGEVGGWIQDKARDFEKQYYKDSYRKVQRLVSNCLNAGREICKRIVKRSDAKQILADAVAQMDDVWGVGHPPRKGSPVAASVAWFLVVFKQNADEMQSEPMGNYIGQGLSEAFDAGLLLADVHLNNIGMPSGPLAEEIGMTPIITDPGHAIALDNRYDNLQVEEL